jgi:hypothetical protein
MIYPHEITNKHMSPFMRGQLLMAAQSVESGHTLWVHLTAPKQGDTNPRVSGKDYVGLPGISPDTQIGPMAVHRYVDNRDNQKLDRVNLVYFKVRSITRANGLQPFGWTGVRPADITGFKILGIESPDPMATEALGQAAAAQTPQGV